MATVGTDGQVLDGDRTLSVSTHTPIDVAKSTQSCAEGAPLAVSVTDQNIILPTPNLPLSNSFSTQGEPSREVSNLDRRRRRLNATPIGPTRKQPIRLASRKTGL